MCAGHDQQDLAGRQHRGKAARQCLARHVVLAAPVASVAAEARGRQRHETRRGIALDGRLVEAEMPVRPEAEHREVEAAAGSHAGVVVTARDCRGQPAVEADGALLGDVEGLGERAHHPAVERAVVTLRDARIGVELRDTNLRGVELAAAVSLGQLAVGAHRRIAGREQEKRIGLAVERRGNRIRRGLAQCRVIVDDDGSHQPLLGAQCS